MKKPGSRFVTVNGSSWSTIREFICSYGRARKAGGVVFFGQEHRLPGCLQSSCSESMAALGWQVAFIDAAPGEGGGHSAGLVMAIPAHLGFTQLQGAQGWNFSPPGSPGRLMAGWSPLAMAGGCMVINSYWWCGEGLSIRNLSLMDAIKDLVTFYAQPYVLGADFNLEPALLEETGWLKDIGGVLIHTGEVTCTGTGAGSNFDYFVVAQSIAHGFGKAKLVEDTGISPHTPVKVEAELALRTKKIYTFWKPKAFELVKPVGCVPPSEAVWPQDNMEEKVEDDVLDAYWLGFCQEAEKELGAIFGIHGHELKPYQGRGQTPRLVYGPVAGPRAEPCPRGNAESRGWRWLANNCRQMLRLVQVHRASGQVHRHWVALRDKLWKAPTRLKALPEVHWGMGQTAMWLAGCRLDDPDSTLGLYCAAAFEMCKLATFKAFGIEMELGRARAGAWRAKVREGSKNGAGFLHRVSKWRPGWKPALKAGVLNETMADDQEATEKEAEDWFQRWDSQGHRDRPEKLPWEKCVFDQPLVVTTVESLDAVCMGFSTRTGIGVDHWHPRHWTWLSLGGKECLVKLLNYISRHRHWPRQVKLLVYFLLAKPEGGTRPIGLLPSLGRTSERLHAGVAEDWERQHGRKYDWALQGKSSEVSAWSQMLADEAEQAKKTGTVSVTLVADLQKAFEFISLFMLWAWHGQLHFPTHLLCYMCEIYTWERTIGYRGAVSKCRAWTTTAIVAGSTFATRAIKIFTYKLLDGVEQLWALEIRLFIDDVSFQARGLLKEVSRMLREVAEQYITGAEQAGAPVSRGADGKSYVIAAALSSRIVVAGWANKMGLKVRSTGVQLGVGVAGGGNINNAPQRRRLGMCLRRKAKVINLKQKGGKTRAVGRHGLIPSIAYGTACHGASPTVVERARMLMSAALPGGTVGKDRTLRLWLSNLDDPILHLTLPPLYSWAAAWWENFQVQDMQDVWKEAHVSLAGIKSPWKRIKGPGTAVLLSLRRIGWTWPAPQVFRTGAGVLLDLRSQAPMLVKDLAQKALERVVLQEWARRHLDGRSFMPFLEPLRALLNRKSNWSWGQQHKAALRAFVGEEYGTQAKLWKMDLVDDRICKACGLAEGTQHHRLCKCPAHDEARRVISEDHKAIHQSFVTSQDDLKWGRGLMEEPTGWQEGDTVSHLEEFCEDSQEEYTREMCLFTGSCYSDGSGKGLGNLRSYGWCGAMVDEQGRLLFGLQGPLPGLRIAMTVLRAEIFALLQILMRCQAPLSVGIDNSTVVKGIRRGRAWCTSAKRPHADLWLKVWNILDDLFPDLQGFECIKVKAHTLKKDRPKEGIELRHYLGNELADKGAKAGAALAMAPEYTQLNYQMHWDRIQQIGRYAADLVVKVGDFKDAEEPQRKKRSCRRRRAAKVQHPHVDDTTVEKGRRCMDCGRWARTPKQIKMYLRETCKGHPIVAQPSVRKRLWTKTKGSGAQHYPRPEEELSWIGPGHALWQTGHYKWCNKCGAISASRSVHLADPCFGKPRSKRARDSRARLRKGHCPTGKAILIGQPRSLGLTGQKVSLTEAEASPAV